MRSLLFVPGDSPRKLDKALCSEADALIIDLEDSVALSRKEYARNITLDFLRHARAESKRPRLFVRVNAIASGLMSGDLEGIMGGVPDGIVLPKAIGHQSIADLAFELEFHEARVGMAGGSTSVLAIGTESARGVFALSSFDHSNKGRLAGLAWGGEDLSADLGAESNRDDNGVYTAPYRLARTLTLLGAASAQVDAIDAVFTNFQDLEGLSDECRLARRDGFVAKMAIHPVQVPVINEAFTPSQASLAYAETVVDLFAKNPEAGVLSLHGQMLDYPHLQRAKRILQRETGEDH
jgi:citrate lyase subunit beta/citryl-CoA lyase